MNCSVCGGPLLFSRVAFRCSCGAYVHAYCLDKHILLAHRPEFEEGTVDLNGEFHTIQHKAEPAAAGESREVGSEEGKTRPEAKAEATDSVEEASVGPEKESAAGEESGHAEAGIVAHMERVATGDVDTGREEERSEESGG